MCGRPCWGKNCRYFSEAKIPKSNIKGKEKQAVISLKNDHDIVITSADKGNCTVVMNKTEYENKILNLLQHQTTYIKAEIPLHKIKEKLNNFIWKLRSKEKISAK